MGKKTVLLFLAAVLVLLCACDKKDEEIEGFHRANYAKYTTTENNAELEGEWLFDDGIIQEVFDEDGHFGFVLENSKGQKWAVLAGQYPKCCPSGLNNLKGKKVRVFFVYRGYSAKTNLPMGNMVEQGKIEVLEGETRAFKTEDFKSSEEEYIHYSELKNWKGFYFNLHRGEYKEKHVSFSGLVTNVRKKNNGITFYFSEKTNGKYQGSHITLSKDYLDTVKEGKGLKILGYVDNDNKFSIEIVKQAETTYSKKVIETAYMNGCWDKFAYMDLYNFHANNKGAYAKLKATLVEAKADTQNNKLYYFTIQLNTSEYVYLTWTAPDNFDKKVLKKGAEMTVYGVLDGITEVEVHKQKTEMPVIKGKYVLFS